MCGQALEARMGSLDTVQYDTTYCMVCDPCCLKFSFGVCARSGLPEGVILETGIYRRGNTAITVLGGIDGG